MIPVRLISRLDVDEADQGKARVDRRICPWWQWMAPRAPVRPTRLRGARREQGALARSKGSDHRVLPRLTEYILITNQFRSPLVLAVCFAVPQSRRKSSKSSKKAVSQKVSSGNFYFSPLHKKNNFPRGHLWEACKKCYFATFPVGWVIPSQCQM